MEAVPKLPLLGFELKTSPENTHFGPKLKHYIAEVYREDAESYTNEIHQLEGLRSAAVRPSIDAAGLNALTRYFCQLRAIQSRFPMGKGQPASCSFVWKDLYANMSSTSTDIRFEMACILYNIGALHTQLGASEPRTAADSLKAACTHFQNAAWAFQHLRTQFLQPPGMDVSYDIMRLLQEICLAQAQECILDKSIQDTRKSSVIGAVATQVMLFYKNALTILGSSTGTDNIHETIGTKLYNFWHRHLSFKMNYIGCIVCLYQGMNAEEQQKMGERVAYYQQAVDKLGEARKLAKYIEPVQVTQEALTFTNDVVEGKRKAAKNENEFIYHEEVPDKDLLMDLKPVCLVKGVPINFNDPAISGPDIFSRLVPMGAHEASSMYSEEKAKLLRHVVNQCEVKNMELTEFMSSLQLDQLDIIDSEQKIPQEIVDRCAAMNAKTEIIQKLVDSMNNLAEIISDVEHSLAEIKNVIQEETLKEKEYQKVMGARPPSIVQTELSREYHKYQEAHARTNESNQVLHKAMTLHIANLKLLSQPLDILQAKIPCIENIEGLDRDKMMEMRRVVGKAHEMQTQRDALVQQLREAIANDDITAQLLASSDTTEDIFKQEIEKHTPKVKIIEQNLAAQENIINKLTSLYASYGESRRLLSDVLRKREGLINALITSHDTYEELLGKSQKGLEFYKKLSHNVNQLLTRLRSTCQVQEEERMQLLATHSKLSNKAAAPAQSSIITPKPSETASTPSGGGLKLKDYLPYMKNRGLARNITPQAQVEALPPDSGYYPETIYPTSVRPAPVGSEDLSQMKMPDGVMPTTSNLQKPYNIYDMAHQNETDPYNASSGYVYSKGYDKPEDVYSTYTPPHFSQAGPQNYAHPYYSTAQEVATSMVPSIMTDSSTAYNQLSQPALSASSQYNPYDNYSQHSVSTSQVAPIPDVTSSMQYNMPQTDLSINFSQIQVTPKSEPAYAEYPQTYYTMQQPQVSTQLPIHISQNSNIPSQLQSNYSSMNYAPTAEQMAHYNQLPTVSNAYNVQDQQYSYATTSNYENISQGYTVYTNADSTSTFSTVSITSVAPVSATISNTFTAEHTVPSVNPVALAQLDALDKPIKSHVTGEALAANVMPVIQNYDAISYPAEQTIQPNTSYAYTDQSVNYTQTYQNHPGYTYNGTTGNYDYSYGSQNSYTSFDGQNDASVVNKLPNWQAQGVYTNAGTYGTMQSPSETPPIAQQTSEQTTNSQTYYNIPYGYQANMVQSNEFVPNDQPISMNCSVSMNQSTYMQSGQEKNTSVTYSNDQVSTPKENVSESNYVQTAEIKLNQNQSSTTESNLCNPENIPSPLQPSLNETLKNAEEPTNVKVEQEEKREPTTFDLLSDIDFTVEQKPLMPEIKVPQASESAIKKTIMPKPETVLKRVPKEDIIERPAKRDLFSDPILLNKFTQEVKSLQKLVDSLTNKMPNGLTLLDSKWKMFHEIQIKENMSRTKTIAMQYSEGNIVTEIVPFDDTRLTLKSDPDIYINASYYKQLASWCIPLVISNNPAEKDHTIFWKAVLENKIGCMVCLLSEIEMQGKSYWPTAKGQSLELPSVKVILDEVKCTVHWTERKLTVTSGKVVHAVTHYQINVFPAKIVCTPLVLLADKVLAETYEGRLSNQLRGAWLQCSAGAGRSAVVALLLMTMCQVRAGQMDLCDMLDKGCINLYKHRSNVLEDTKYLADAYRTALFYVQGVLCSGTTMFNGEAVSMPSGASVLPPVTPAPVASSSSTTQRPQKFTRESFEEMKQSPGLKSGDMKDPLNFLDPLWSLKRK